MDPTTRIQAAAAASPAVQVPGRERLPWAGLLALAGTTFVVVTGEMLPTAVLPVLAADLDVPVARAGLLVSVWAATVVVAAFPLARLTARLERRRVITAALVVFAGANLVTALSGSFPAAAGSRIVAAAATGLLWSTVNAHAAAIVPEHRIGRAASVVLGGGTLGTVLAVPAGNAAAELWGWRPVFVALTLLAVAAAAAVLTVLPSVPHTTSGGAAAGARPRRSLRPVLVLAGLGGLLLAAHFAAFTFVTALLAERGSAVPTSVLLLLLGLLSAVGVVLAGQVGDRFPRGTTLSVAVALAVSLAALAVLGVHPMVDLALVAVWGLASGAVGPAVQTGMMRAAGAEHRDTAGTLLPVAFNLGIALGAAGGAAVVAELSLGVLPPLAAALAVLAVLALALTGRRGTVHDRRRAAVDGGTETSRRRRPEPLDGGTESVRRSSPEQRAVGSRRARDGSVRIMGGTRATVATGSEEPCHA